VCAENTNIPKLPPNARIFFNVLHLELRNVDLVIAAVTAPLLARRILPEEIKNLVDTTAKLSQLVEWRPPDFHDRPRDASLKSFQLYGHFAVNAFYDRICICAALFDGLIHGKTLAHLRV
jgi:hypothetical protein